ncbi:MAG: methyltransferase domain-containing protein [Pirellulales bacterium]
MVTSWGDDCANLQCLECGGGLAPSGEDSLRCVACGRVYPVRDGVLDCLGTLAGNNKLAADFYDSSLWPVFRIWERLTFFSSGGERRARSEVLQHLPALFGTRLLEVGIGDGANLALVPEDCRVFGNDIAPVQLTTCRRRFPRRDLRLLLCEAERLPFRAGTFDNVLSVGAFNYFSDPAAALLEMARVVKPGGVVVVADEAPKAPSRLAGRWSRLRRLDQWIMRRVFGLKPEFIEMMERHRNLKIEPIADEVLCDWKIEPIWKDAGYCLVGRPKR